MTAKINPESYARSIEEKLRDEIFELQERLHRAYLRQDELNREKLTISRIIQRKKECDVALCIIETYSTPDGVVVIVD